ncbi:MAG: Zn-ribbon containing protein [Candidatus Undinarchaeales archaeon]
MHKCLKCKKLYSDEDVPIVEGCSCGSRLFLYMKGKKMPEISEKAESEIFEKIEELDEERKSEETEVEEKKPSKKQPELSKGIRREKSSGFGIETIRLEDAGVYEINIKALMRGRPMIVLSKGGSYVISLPSAFGGEEGEEDENLDV